VEAKRGRRKTTDDTGIAVGGIRASTADERKKEEKVPNTNFYRFQQREKRQGPTFRLPPHTLLSAPASTLTSVTV